MPITKNTIVMCTMVIFNWKFFFLLFCLVKGYASPGNGKEDDGSSSSFSKVNKSYFNTVGKNRLTDESDLVKQGNELVQRKEFVRAINFYTGAIKKNSNEASYYQLRGNCYIRIRDLDSALSDFMKAVSLSKAAPPGKYGTPFMNNEEFEDLGRKLFRARRFKAALWCFTEAINRKPDEAFYHGMRGVCHINMENWDAAVVDFKNAVIIEPENQEFRNRLLKIFLASEKYDEALDESIDFTDDELAWFANHLRNDEKYEEAIRFYSKAIEKNPVNTDSYKNRGKCYQALKNWDKTISDFKQFLQIEPKDVVIRHLLIRTFLALDRLDEAAQESLHSEDVESVKIVGEELCSRKKFDEAIEFYSENIRRNSSEASFYKLRSDCYVEMQHLGMAISDLRKCVDIEPNNQELRIHLSKALLDSGFYNEAVQEMIISDNDAELARLGNQLTNLDKFEEAIGCYDEAIKRNPLNQTYYEKRGMSYLRLKKFDDAILNFVKSLEIVPHDIAVQADLCQALTDAGRYSEARQGLQLFLKHIEYRKNKYGVLSKSDMDKVEKVRQKLKKADERPFSSV